MRVVGPQTGQYDIGFDVQLDAGGLDTFISDDACPGLYATRVVSIVNSMVCLQ